MFPTGGDYAGNRHGGAAPPAPPLTNLVAWFSKGTGITSAVNAVSAWADQSGNGHDLTQATGAAQPTLQAGGTILFDGVNDFLLSAGFTLNQPITWYLRLRRSATQSGNNYLVDGISNTTTVIFFPDSSNAPATFMGSSGPVGSAIGLSTWASVAVVGNGAASTVRVDAVTSSVGNVGAANAGGITLGGGGGGGGTNALVEIAEVLIYNVAHDATQQATVITYLGTR